MSSAQIFRRNIALQNLLQATELRPAELQAIKSTSLALPLSRAVETVVSHTPTEPTVKLILKSGID